MADLIDRDVFRAEHRFAERCENCERDGWRCDYVMYSARDICQWLDDADTVDAVPIRRGRWIPEPDRHYHWYCSECGFVEGVRAMISKYCPNCGADLREVEKDG